LEPIAGPVQHNDKGDLARKLSSIICVVLDHFFLL